MKKISFLIFTAFLVVSCSNEQPEPQHNTNILMLKVDFLTNTFEGGYEFNFKNAPDEFTLSVDYQPAADLGYIKLYYDEIDELLFNGTMVWRGGCGQIDYPANLLPASAFDVVSPVRGDGVASDGFEKILAENNLTDATCDAVWANIKDLSKVVDYLHENPGQKIRIFLYTPSVGRGNPADWDWILFLEK